MEASNIRLKAALEATRLERLAQRFTDEGIGDDILNQLREEYLEKLGVTCMGDRKRLTRKNHHEGFDRGGILD